MRGRVNAGLIAGAVLVGIVVLAALVSFVWTPHDPTLVEAANKLREPGGGYLLGADKFGRDTFSQLMVGARTTLYVGIVAVGIAALIGTPLGMIAGMTPRGWLSELIMRVNDLVFAFPALLLAVMLGAVYGAGTLTAMIAIGVATVPAFARVARAATMQVMVTDYILAARAAGRRRAAIAVRHVLPNIGSMLIVQASVSFAIAILAEAALSFLGVGVQPPTPSWGAMISEATSIFDIAWWFMLFPGLALLLTVLAFNLVGDGLQDALNPRTAK
jgi:peptide/nickel transport system permease protein